MPTERERIAASVKKMEAQNAPVEVIKQYLEAEAKHINQGQPTVDKSRGLGITDSFMMGSGSMLETQKKLAHRFGEQNVQLLDDGEFAVREWGGDWFTANKPGADISDIARYADSVGEMFGGTAGGTAGGLLTKHPAGVMAGEGIGAAAGRGLVKGTQELIGGPGYPQTGLVDAAKDLTTTAGVNALAPVALSKAGGAILRAPGKAMNKLVSPNLSGIAGDLSKGGIPTSLDLVSEGDLIKSYYNFIGDLPGGGKGTILKHSRKQLQAAAKNAEKVVKSFGGAKTHEKAGKVIYDSAPKNVEKYKGIADTLYNQIAKDIGRDTPITPSNTLEGLQGLIDGLKIMPKSNAAEIRGLESMLKGVVDDAKKYGGELPFDAFKAYRGKQLERMTDPLLHTIKDVSSGKLDRIYGMMTKDIEDAIIASGAGEETLKQFRDVNSIYTKIKNVKLPLFERIQRSGSVEAAYDIAMEKSKKGGTMLRNIKKDLTKEEWGAVAGFTLAKLGKPTAGAQAETGVNFSVQAFMTNWDRLAPEAKDALFYGTEYAKLRPSLDRLVRTLSKMGNVEKLADSTIRSRGIYGAMILAPLAGYGIFSGIDPLAVAGMALLPAGTAKLMTNKTFVQWMTGAVRLASEKPSLLVSHTARLGAMAAREPSIEQEILQYKTAIEMQQKQIAAQEISK